MTTHFSASSANDAPKLGLEMPEIVVPWSAAYVEGLGLFWEFLKYGLASALLSNASRAALTDTLYTLPAVKRIQSMIV
jgi:hypothetical protein